MRFSPGCGCCGGGGATGRCCNGCDLESASITNLSITDNNTSVTWTQNGSSTIDLVADEDGCRFNVPVIDGDSNTGTAIVTHAWATYSGQQATTPNGSSWQAQYPSGPTASGDPTWLCGDTRAVSIDYDEFGESVDATFDVSGHTECGCCDDPVGSGDGCHYTSDSVSNMVFDVYTQNGPSRWINDDYCGWLVPVLVDLGGFFTQSQMIVRRIAGATTGQDTWTFQPSGGSTNYASTVQGCSVSSGTIRRIAPANSNVGSFDASSDGTCDGL